MNLSEVVPWCVDVVRSNAALGPAIVLVLAFGESLAFVSLLLPATLILVGVGAAAGAGGLPLAPLWLGATVGAVLGDWLSYALGRRLGPGAAGVWPLARHPGLLVLGSAFFDRWGAWGVFLGRFSGPLRASVRLVAGVCAMPAASFQAANVASAMVWSFAVLSPGVLGGAWLADRT